MTIEQRIDEQCRRLGLDACLAVRRTYRELPPHHSFVLPPLPAGVPPVAAVLARANTRTLDGDGVRVLIDSIAGRPVEQAALARDLLAGRFVSEIERRSLRELAERFPALAATPPQLAVDLDDDELWSALGDGCSELADNELDRRAEALDVAALAEICRRERGAALLTDPAARRWRGWAEVLSQAHFPIWSSLVAGLLAREGDAAALVLWCDVAGDDSLRHPGQLDDNVPLSRFGAARDRVAAADLRLVQLALRLRRASNGGTTAAIQELLAMPIPAGNLDAVMRVLAARVEASVRIGQSEPQLDEVVRHAAAHPSWRYGRWAGLLGLVAGGRLPAADLTAAVDEYWASFGGSSALYCELARFARDDGFFHTLIHRAIGDVVDRPDAGDLWVAFAMCLGEGELATRARAEVWDRLAAQLP
jgi:hypothetical protein